MHVAGTRSLRQVNPTLLKETISDYCCRLSASVIAERYGIRRQTAAAHLVEGGVTLRRTITDVERQRARKLYDSGA